MIILAVNDLYMGHTKLRITGIARTPSPAIGKGLTSVGSVDNEQRLSQVIHVVQSIDNKGIYGKNNKSAIV